MTPKEQHESKDTPLRYATRRGHSYRDFAIKAGKLRSPSQVELQPVQRMSDVEFYLYPTVGTLLIHSIKPELTE